jgi:hypothetical protein
MIAQGTCELDTKVFGLVGIKPSVTRSFLHETHEISFDKLYNISDMYIYIYIYIVPPRNAKPQVCRNENGGHFEGVMAALMLGGSLPSQGYTNPECGDLGSPDRTPKRLR